MSDLAQSLREATVPELKRLADQISTQFLDGLSEVLSDADEHTRARVQTLLGESARFKWQAMTADDADKARLYAEAVETSVRRVKTLLLAEAVVAEEKIASTISALWGSALDGLTEIAKGLLSTLAQAAVQGAIQGVTGGSDGSFDLSQVFPFA